MILNWLCDSSTSLLKVLIRQALGMTRIFMSTGGGRSTVKRPFQAGSQACRAKSFQVGTKVGTELWG